MKCPYCGHKELKVIDSRESPDMNAIRRRRECLDCLRRFTTFETIELSVQVLKRNGMYEDYQQQKLISGLDAACRHTTISHDQVIAIASQVTEGVMKKLKALDPIAYIRFACEYRRFKDIDELIEEIQSIESKDEGLRKTNILK